MYISLLVHYIEQSTFFLSFMSALSSHIRHHSSRLFSLGTKSQEIPIAMISPTRIGCMILTPARLAMMPVTAGKNAPPA
jgi:hypothetical protein